MSPKSLNQLNQLEPMGTGVVRVAILNELKALFKKSAEINNIKKESE